MKKIILYTMITSALTGFTCLASEKPIDKNIYLRLDVGKSKAKKLNDNDAYINDKLKTSNILSFGVGKYLDSNFRTDITLTLHDYRLNNNVNNQTRTQKIKSTSAMINGYYDFNYFGNITPYLSVGLGVAHNNSGKLEIVKAAVDDDPQTTTTYNKKTVNSLAWQVGAGTAIRINDLLSLDIGYKYIDLGKAKTTQGSSVMYDNGTSTKFETPPAAKGKLTAQEITAGIRYNF